MHLWLAIASALIWIGFIFYWSASAGGGAAAATPSGQRRPWISIQFKRAAPPGASGGGATSVVGSAEAGGSAAASPGRESARSRQVHQLLLWGALLLALLPGFYPLSRRWLPDAWYVAPTGLAVQAAFALLYIWARRHLGRYWSGVVQTKADHRLIRTGPYRWLRHPMYTAMVGMFLGTAIVSGEFHGLAALVIGAFAYIRKIRIEERRLGEFFGPAYDEYRRESWALIPGLI